MFTLEYAIREVPENQVCSKNWMGHTSFWSVPMILIYWGKSWVPQKNTEVVVDASVEVGLEVNADKN
jgi:hypothetical protein